MNRYKRGSNQYIKRYKGLKAKTWRDVAYLILCIVVVALLGHHYQQENIMISPIPLEVKAQSDFSTNKVSVERHIFPTIPPAVNPSPTPVYVDPPNPDVDQEIRRVFGKYYAKAMILLKGQTPTSCHENGSLDPDVENTNTDGSRDIGVFQINTFWHGFNHDVNNERYLKDPNINIAMAWHIFRDSGYNFSLWTCGKYYGI